jgi:hypothetical protein
MIHHSFFAENKTHVIVICKNRFYLMYTDQEGVANKLLSHNLDEDDFNTIIDEVQNTDTIPDYLKESIIDILIEELKLCIKF